MVGTTVFVTVGSTRFDALIRSVDSTALADALIAQGYTKLVMQIGNAQYTPHTLFPDGTGCRRGTYRDLLDTEYFDYAPSLAAHMAGAALIISHAGSGSIFEALRLKKVLIAVPNPILMANHQAELAGELAQRGFVYCATTGDLAQTVSSMEKGKLVEYSPGNPADISRCIDELMGV